MQDDFQEYDLSSTPPNIRLSPSNLIDMADSNVVDDMDGRIDEVEEEQVEEDVVVQDGDQNNFQKKSRKKRSKVWDEFTIIKLPQGTKGECIHCKRRLKVNGSTTQFKRHLEVCPRRSRVPKGQTKLNLPPKNSEVETSVVYSGKYDHAKQREAIAHWILATQKPFNVVEDPTFTFMFKVNHPEFEKISRTMAKNDCMTVYELEKMKLKTHLETIKKISLTTDIWKSEVQKKSYMCVTGHFLDNWKLQKRVLTFVTIPPPHGGIEIAEALMRCIEDWGIGGKVFTISVDNASNNDAAMRILKKTFSNSPNLLLEGKLFHVKCCAHILNLVVQDGLAEIKKTIEKVKDSVCFLNKSEARILRFSEIVNQMNLGGRKLIYDCTTRWNSTYEMLESALRVKDAFPVYADRDPTYKHCPTSEEWEKARQVLLILKVFYDATQVISGSDYPTSNQFYALIWRVKEVMNAKALDADPSIRSMVAQMKIKFDKYWGDLNLLMSIANVLDPRCKLKMVEFSFQTIYGGAAAQSNLGLVRSSLQTLYNDYSQLQSSRKRGVSSDNSTSTQGFSSSTQNCGNEFMSLTWDRFDKYLESAQNDETTKSDLDLYLEEGVHRCKENVVSTDFDVLEWWKVNESKYPILSKMARDILAIPITTVASEATFSVSGRILDPYRSALNPGTMEALVCAGDWVRRLHGLKNKSEFTEPVVIDLTNIQP